MLRISEILRISRSVDEQWRSPLADSVAAPWGVRAGSARWLRSSATHVFVIPSTTDGDTPTYLRFAPAGSSAGTKIETTAPLLAEWADRGLGAVKPIPGAGGRLVETVHTPEGRVTAMLVPEAPGDEVSVQNLTAQQSAAWGEALAMLHAQGAGKRRPGMVRGSGGVAQGSVAAVELPDARHEGPLARSVRAVVEEITQLPRQQHSQGFCHGDFELDNIRFGAGQVTFFDADEAHHGWFAADVALAVRDLTGVTLGAEERPALLAEFLKGYRRRRPFTEAEEASLPLHSLAVSARLVRQLEDVLDTGNSGQQPQWARDLDASLREHQDWHRERLLQNRP